jgi:hypothetical protein
VLVAFLLGVTLPLACSPQSAPRGNPSTPSAAQASASATSEPLPAASSATRARSPLPEGCFAEAPRDAEPQQLMAEVMKSCELGARPSPQQPSRWTLAEGEMAELHFELQTQSCVRWVAVAAPSVHELALALLDSAETSLAEDGSKGNLALLNPLGPVCLDAGKYVVRIRAQEGAGVVLLRGFGASASAPSPERKPASVPPAQVP